MNEDARDLPFFWIISAPLIVCVARSLIETSQRTLRRTQRPLRGRDASTIPRREHGDPAEIADLEQAPPPSLSPPRVPSVVLLNRTREDE